MVEAVRVSAGPRIREWAQKSQMSDWMAARFAKVADLSGLDASARGRFLDGLRRKAPQYVRANPLRTTAKTLQVRLEARGFRLAPTQMDPHVFRLHEAPISPGATLEHLLGHSSPQDLASASAGIALGARPGDVVADLAAAPGMKTLHIAGDMKDRGAIVAVEPDEERLPALQKNLERGGVSCAAIRHETGQELPGEAWADKVLLDAPCTGEGTMPKDRNRRRGDIAEIGRLASLQEELLDAADRVLKPGGVLVYATCTFAPEENEIQVARMMERGYRIEPIGLDTCEGAPLGRGLTEWPGHTLPDEMQHARRFFPGVHPTLGFFVARLRKEDA